MPVTIRDIEKWLDDNAISSPYVQVDDGAVAGEGVLLIDGHLYLDDLKRLARFIVEKEGAADVT